MKSPPIDEDYRRKYRAKLLTWYRRARRDLPWRKTDNPYRIWISEIMLQQTRVDSVVPYYHRFLSRFPTVEHLARSGLPAVLKAWEGLGYYARARNLHRTARQIRDEFGGQFPREPEAARSLPGVGPYTAAAVLSIAYNQPLAVLDGNVARVLCRVFAVEDPPKSTRGQQRLQALAQDLLSRRRPGAFNQAMMELGALVCMPARPVCPRCPFKKPCRARTLRKTEAFPVRVPTRKIPHYDVAAALIEKNGRLLITRRPEKGLLGGLWEFPGGKVEKGESFEEALVREIREELDIGISVETHFESVRHAYSHFRITLHVFRCRHRAGRPKAIACEAWEWITPGDLDRYAFPRADRKIIEKLQALR